MRRRATITIGVRRYVGGVEDDFGNVTDTWAPEEQVGVYAIAPAGSDEPGAGRDAVTDDLDVYAPSTVSIGPRDKLTINGASYDVEGHPADYTQGPYASRPGVVIRARRVTG